MRPLRRGPLRRGRLCEADCARCARLKSRALLQSMAGAPLLDRDGPVSRPLLWRAPASASPPRQSAAASARWQLGAAAARLLCACRPPTRPVPTSRHHQSTPRTLSVAERAGRLRRLRQGNRAGEGDGRRTFTAAGSSFRASSILHSVIARAVFCAGVSSCKGHRAPV